MSSINALNEHATRVRTFIDTSCGLTATGQTEEAERIFNALALELFALQYETNGTYRRTCEARGVSPGQLNAWQQIPAIPTAAFKELEFSCIAPDQHTAVFLSSGTTGQARSRHFHNAESLSLYEASLLTWFDRHIALGSSHGPGVLALVLTPPAEEAPNSSLAHMFSTICRTPKVEDVVFTGAQLADGSWQLDPARAIGPLRKAAHGGKPVLVMGTAFLYVHLLDELATKGERLALPPGSIALETGGYKGRSRALPKAELHQLISTRLGIHPNRIVCEYGMSELSSQAYDLRIDETARYLNSPRERLFQFPPWAGIQVISPESGAAVAEDEIGLLRIVDLANVYSALAIQTEDLARRRRTGFELLGRAAAAEARGCSLMSLHS